MRQNNLSKEHFKSLLSLSLEYRDKFIEKLKENRAAVYQSQAYSGLVDGDIEAIIISYTLGYKVSELAPLAKNVFDSIAQYGELDQEGFAPDNILEQYIQCTWILSFAYFFNAERNDIEKIIPHIPYTGKDKLIDRLIAAIVPEHPVSQDIAFPDVYKPICDAMGVYDKDARDVLVQLFLKKYYPSLKKHDVTWYDSHKEKDPEYNFHTGYWVFELAAIAVAIGWDDTDFRDNMYYPKDLADWKREQLNKENL